MEDVNSAVDSLCQLPSLRALRINLHEESQVDYLLRRLEGLEELNGLAVERDALFNDGEEDEGGNDGLASQMLQQQEDDGEREDTEEE
jgi:hypothetical protein